ncbi:MAG TPA: prepilin-type N-terminal cleavage/methylation domain-containing protein [Thermoanaerobaculia bacterium]|nr:prepilin-type N-terminal cleavage/methylation domain-containing protein [Thermoanaerobaculia bacterium]
MNRRPQKGYSLIEVLIAVAITGVVIMSIFTVITLAKRNIYSGKQMTAANAVATRVLEDLSLMSATDVLLNFNITNGTTLSSPTVAGVSYPGSVLRDTDGTISSTTDPSGYLARWQGLLGAATFQRGRVVLVITPANARTPATAPVTTAQVIRVRGFVEWSEGVRRRNVSFESSKLQRP